MPDISEINHQHQQLVSKLNHLNDAVHKLAARQKIYQIIDEIIADTRAHFAAEEQLMAQSGYPEIELHRDKHRQLLEDAQHLKAKLEYVGEEMFTAWFTHWPFSRVLAHIQYADKQLEEHLQKPVQ